MTDSDVKFFRIIIVSSSIFRKNSISMPIRSIWIALVIRIVFIFPFIASSLMAITWIHRTITL